MSFFGRSSGRRTLEVLNQDDNIAQSRPQWACAAPEPPEDFSADEDKSFLCFRHLQTLLNAITFQSSFMRNRDLCPTWV